MGADPHLLFSSYKCLDLFVSCCSMSVGGCVGGNLGGGDILGKEGHVV